jgi:hypothetical protein
MSHPPPPRPRFDCWQFWVWRGHRSSDALVPPPDSRQPRPPAAPELREAERRIDEYWAARSRS